MKSVLDQDANEGHLVVKNLEGTFKAAEKVSQLETQAYFIIDFCSDTLSCQL